MIINRYKVMKTKIIYTCLIGAAALLGISSCTDLKDTNYTNVVADGFQPTDEDVASLLSSAYVSWRKTMLLWNGVARAEMLSTDQDVILVSPITEYLRVEIHFSK